MTQRWRTLVLLYPVLDARYGSGLQRSRVQRVMTREERGVVMDVVERLPATVEAWSDGLATLEPFDVVEVRRSIRSLSSSGGGRWWVGPREVRPELESIAETGATYDSVYALWPCEPSVPQCGWGCTLGPSEATFHAGFSSISTDHWRTLLTDPDPEQGYVHEWLHQVEAVYRALGVSEDELPPLHDAGGFTSARPRRRGAVRADLRRVPRRRRAHLGAVVPRLDDRPPRPGGRGRTRRHRAAAPGRCSRSG